MKLLQESRNFILYFIIRKIRKRKKYVNNSRIDIFLVI